MSFASNKNLARLKKSETCRVSSLPLASSDSKLYNLNHNFQRQVPSTSSISSISSINIRLNKRYLSNELDQIIKRLEQGCVLIRFLPKAKPEKRTLVINNETKQLICLKPNAGKDVTESIISLFDVKEIRIGRVSKTFEKWSEDAKKYDNNQCFVVLYGNTFCLKSLSCVGKSNQKQARIRLVPSLQIEIHNCKSPFPTATSVKECDQWVRCIQFTSQETLQLSYFRLLNKWLKFEFNNLANEKSL